MTGLEIDPVLVAAIALGILTSTSGLLAYKYRQAKTLLKEGAELLTVTSAAIQDDAITDEEIAAITVEVDDFIAAAKDLATF